MNPFRKIANSLMNWWKGETAPEVSDSTELTGGDEAQLTVIP